MTKVGSRARWHYELRDDRGWRQITRTEAVKLLARYIKRSKLRAYLTPEMLIHTMKATGRPKEFKPPRGAKAETWELQVVRK